MLFRSSPGVPVFRHLQSESDTYATPPLLILVNEIIITCKIRKKNSGKKCSGKSVIKRDYLLFTKTGGLCIVEAQTYFGRDDDTYDTKGTASGKYSGTRNRPLFLVPQSGLLVGAQRRGGCCHGGSGILKIHWR